jgi:hypothetical protein
MTVGKHLVLFTMGKRKRMDRKRGEEISHIFTFS